jgi:hypothetical protein
MISIRIKISRSHFASMRYHRQMRRKDEKMTEPVLVRLKPSMAQLVDAWRREQIDLPTRAEAIRRLAAMALKAQGKDLEKSEKTSKGRKGSV